ncbi:sulfur carrier protein ThiS [Arenimonas terrae]|jgi:sulfur carrier protein|uniref:Sulfur carrier protein ThiS n=1 Tax=Arenimonas terrae TaxID=2546226 RepID=A0A5C4RS11_9GAMM|nr:sulfur carrier protein ThiS [Arenimonas terrae]TNJ33745.1 sulfur carrier protein ThiS [Arenimonas terrae]
MQITLNGESRDIAPGTTVSALLALAGYGGRKVAVEVNLAVVPRSQHDQHALADGDRVEIIHAIGGG